MDRAAVLVFCLALPLAVVAGEDAAWGEAKGGLQIALAQHGAASVGGKIAFDLTLRNAGAEAVRLGPGKELFAWLFVAQAGNAANKALFTDKLFPASQRADWPEMLAAEKALDFKDLDFSVAAARPYERGLKMAGGYPTVGADDAPPVGELHDAVIEGPAKARVMLCVPRPEGAVLLVSNTLEIRLGAPPPSGNPAADLLRQFDKDAFAAMKAHDEAVKRGKAVLPALVAAARERKRPDFSRLWLATALADIPDETAVQALTALLDDPLGGVRCVVAYHGPKQKSEKLDQAILARAKTGKDDAFTAYALLGFLVFRNRVPPELLRAGLESDDPRARVTATQALAGMASDFNRGRLNELLKDKDPQVRATAKKALDAMKPQMNADERR